MHLFQTHATATSFRRLAHAVALAILGALIVYGTARADASHEMGHEMDHEMDNLGAGSLFFAGPGGRVPAPRVSTDVAITISGLAARVRVSQAFRNDSSEWLEGVYAFPLPATAAVDHLRMQIGERVIVGEIQPRKIARQQYEAARSSGRKASLIEQERANIFTNSVANIGPGETVLIEIEYQQRVDYDNGEFRLRFPLAITPRYAPPADSTTTADVQRVALLPAGDRVAASAGIKVVLDAGFPLESVTSAYHEVDKFPTARGVALQLTGGRVAMDQDFVLSWRPVLGAEPTAAVFTESLGEARYSTLR